jgi:tetratricopeptide (TPR) repeat protein
MENLHKQIVELNGLLDDKPQEVISSLEDILDRNDIGNLKSEYWLDILGLLIDASREVRSLSKTERAIIILETMDTDDLSSENLAKYHYRLGSGYGLRRRLMHPQNNFFWKNYSLEREIFNYRSAFTVEEIDSLGDEFKCKNYANLGNSLSDAGRIIEAIEAWNKAISIDPDFSQAIGQKGMGLMRYSRYHYDQGHKGILLKKSHNCLEESLKGDNLYPMMARLFNSKRKQIQEIVPKDFIEKELDLDEYELGKTKEEEKYRNWCLDNKLFLNSLNDIGSHSIAAQDILHLASLSSESSNKIVSCVGFYNQLKQEYISARYFLYEGVHGGELHFADKDTNLENTLDYPDYSIYAEKLRMSLRMAYSIFDKISSFLQFYFGLSYIPDHKVGFGNVWYKSRGKNQIAPEFENIKNWSLRALFWLSKDLDYFSNLYAEDSIEPGSKELRDIRNDLEHDYLKLHKQKWNGRENEDRLRDERANSFDREEFEEKALETVKKARAALIYLSLAIGHEESKKGDKPKVPLELGEWKDEFKKQL